MMRKRAESKIAESKEAESSRLKGKILAQRQLEAQNQRMNEENFMQFGYENLEVWNKAVDFAVKVIDTVENISTDRKHYIRD